MRTRMIRVNAILPGYIETDMTQGKYLLTPPNSAGFFLYCSAFFFTRSSLPAIFHIGSQEVRVPKHNSQDRPLFVLLSVSRQYLPP